MIQATCWSCTDLGLNWIDRLFWNGEEQRAPNSPLEQGPATETRPNRVRWIRPNLPSIGPAKAHVSNGHRPQQWRSSVPRTLLPRRRRHKEVLQWVSPHGILLLLLKLQRRHVFLPAGWPGQGQPKQSPQGGFGPRELNQRACPWALGWALLHPALRREELEFLQRGHISRLWLNSSFSHSLTLSQLIDYNKRVCDELSWVAVSLNLNVVGWWW